MAEDWRSRAGRIVLDLVDPEGYVVTTPLERRWLWRIEAFLAVSGTTDEQRRLSSDLRSYLNETCEHHWQDRGAEGHIESHRQCLWCSDVEWASETGEGQQA